MGQEALLQKLDEAASRARSLEGENAEAVAKIQALEREVGELKELISLAESKADEMLQGEPAGDVSKGQVVPKEPAANAPLKSKGLEELAEASASQQKELKRRLPHALKQNVF